MFYLRIWTLIFKKHFLSKLVLGGLFLSIIPALALVKTYTNITPEDPYFHVLFQSNEENSNIKERLVDLPGILAIEAISAEKIKGQLKKMLDGESLSLLNEVDFNYSGLQVSISSDLREKAQSLLQTYIEKMAGDDVEISPTFYPKSNSTSFKSLFFQSLNYQLIFLGVCWLFISFIFSRQENKYFYLTKQFNKDRNFRMKVYLTNFILFFTLLSTIVFLVHGGMKPKIIGSFLVGSFIIGLTPYLTKNKWQA